MPEYQDHVLTDDSPVWEDPNLPDYMPRAVSFALKYARRLADAGATGVVIRAPIPWPGGESLVRIRLRPQADDKGRDGTPPNPDKEADYDIVIGFNPGSAYEMTLVFTPNWEASDSEAMATNPRLTSPPKRPKHRGANTL